MNINRSETAGLIDICQIMSVAHCQDLLQPSITSAVEFEIALKLFSINDPAPHSQVLKCNRLNQKAKNINVYVYEFLFPDN